jgi:hypothetical protein
MYLRNVPAGTSTKKPMEKYHEEGKKPHVTGRCCTHSEFYGQAEWWQHSERLFCSQGAIYSRSECGKQRTATT